MITTLCRIALAVSRTRSDVADLLEIDSNNWEWTLFEVTHKPSGIVVWVANDAYGLHVDIDKQRWDPSFFEKRIIWAAAKKVIVQNRAKAERRLFKTVKKAISDAQDA